MNGKKHTELHKWRERATQEDLPCRKCGRVGLMTLDHIVPISFIQQLGLREEAYDDDWNFQYLCRACNLLKGSQLDYNNPKTIENIRRYVDLAEQTYCNPI